MTWSWWDLEWTAPLQTDLIEDDRDSERGIVITELIICIILYYVTIYIWHPAYISVCYVVISEFGLSVTGARNCSASCECTPRQQTTVTLVKLLIWSGLMCSLGNYRVEGFLLCFLSYWYLSQEMSVCWGPGRSKSFGM